MKTKANNAVLAQFLGWFTEDGQPETWFKIIDNAQYVIYQQYNDLYGELPFHKDWNYLNEIVEKIESLGYTTSLVGSKNGFAFSIQFEKVCVFNYNNSTDKKEAVYKGCVEFCQWYKETNKDNGK